MKNNTESKKTATPKTSKAKREPAAKAPKAPVEAAKPAKKSKEESEPVDRLPSNIDELKASKSGWSPTCSCRARTRMRSRGAQDGVQAAGRAGGEDRAPDYRPGAVLPAGQRAHGGEVGHDPAA
jgi:hypothetical protein